MKINLFICFLILFSCNSYGQIDSYNYKCELKNVSQEWHKIVLPNEVFGKLRDDLSDIRIFGVTNNSDTIESPYIIRQLVDKVRSKNIEFKRLNTASSDNGFYFTVEVPTREAINQIKLDFKQENFDWTVKVEGSQDQLEWFTVVENYRILSFNNNNTDFQFTNLSFPNSKYRYFRLLIDSKVKPELTKIGVAQYNIDNGEYRSYAQLKTNIKNDKTAKKTIIDLDLHLPVTLSQLIIDVDDDYDYYRPIMIQYLNDSIKTEKGWKYNYRTLAAGTLNSLTKNEFTFKSKVLKKLRVVISNHDNQPLKINSVKPLGHVYELVARFTESADYYMVYGNKSVRQAMYDISRFENNIPDDLVSLTLGEEQVISKKGPLASQPLFKSKFWLWGIMGVIILILGWFSLSMFRNVN